MVKILAKVLEHLHRSEIKVQLISFKNVGAKELAFVTNVH
jgi:hypothetical protein